MTLTAFLHGYPPLWSMGGEMSTHRTLRAVPWSVVFTDTLEDYRRFIESACPLLAASSGA